MTGLLAVLQGKGSGMAGESSRCGKHVGGRFLRVGALLCLALAGTLALPSPAAASDTIVAGDFKLTMMNDNVEPQEGVDYEYGSDSTSGVDEGKRLRIMTSEQVIVKMKDGIDAPATSDRITIDPGAGKTADVTLEGIKISYSTRELGSVDSHPVGKSPIDIASGNVTLRPLESTESRITSLTSDTAMYCYAGAALRIGANASLRIVGRGALSVCMDSEGIGIGSACIGGNRNEQSGRVEIVNGQISLESSSKFPIEGAALGSGEDGSSEGVTISGGKVSITMSSVLIFASGIGSGSSASSGPVRIGGGEVDVKTEASGSQFGSAIGGGFVSNSDVNISGGCVKIAYSGSEVYGNAIGAGYLGPAGQYELENKLSITGGKFADASMEDGTVYGAKVDKGYVVRNNEGGDRGAYPYEVALTLGGFTVSGGENGVDYEYGRDATVANDYRLLIKTSKPLTVGMAEGVASTADRIVIDPGSGNKADVTLDGIKISYTSKTGTNDSTSHVVGKSPIDVVNGEVALRLADGSISEITSLTNGFDLSAGFLHAGAALHISKGTTLSIEGPGSLAARVEDSNGNGLKSACIGGNPGESTGSVEIKGGTVKASAYVKNVGLSGIKAEGAAIGAGKDGSCAGVTISGGKVTANVEAPNIDAAGIGSGASSAAGTSSCPVRIAGGTVSVSSKATGSNQGAAIGGGYQSNSDVTISGGAVKVEHSGTGATGSKIGAGVKAEDEGITNSLTIAGGKFADKDADAKNNTVYGAKVSKGYVLQQNAGSDKDDYPYEVINPTGDFTVSGGKLGEDYTYQDNVLTVKTEKALTIGMSVFADDAFTYDDNVFELSKEVKNGTKADRIVVDPGASKTANVTLSGVAIDMSDIYGVAALSTTRGKAHIKLAEGSINVLLGGGDAAGLSVGTGGIELDGAGSLYAEGGDGGAGIGSGKGAAAGDIAVALSTTGTISVLGGSCGAGIGSGHDGRVGDISVAGGTVNARGLVNGAGIGTGMDGSGGVVSISGGTIDARANEGGAAIGTGFGLGDGTDSSVKKIVVSGGRISARTESLNAAAIGSEKGGAVSQGIEISGGFISADQIFGSTGKPIGAGGGAKSVDVTITGGEFDDGEVSDNAAGDVYDVVPANGYVVVDMGHGTYRVVPYATGDFTITGGEAKKDYAYAEHVLTVKSETKLTIGMADTAQADISYTDVDGKPQTVKGTMTDRIVIGTTADETARITLNGVAIDPTEGHPPLFTGVGKVDIVLAKEKTSVLNARGNSAGLDVGLGGLAISGDGVLVATGGTGGAGIGSGGDGSSGDIAITSGTVVATGGVQGAGIGSGCDGSVGNVIVSGGAVRAVGGESGAGIGSGEYGSATNISVTGGVIVAHGGDYGAGIGAGAGSDNHPGTAESVIISEGSVTATGGSDAAGIGAGEGGSAKGVSISGGAIKAVAGQGASAIGTVTGAEVPVDVTITGGVFADGVVDSDGAGNVYGVAPAARHVVENNTDDETKGRYPYRVAPYATGDFVVTGGEAKKDYVYAEHVLTVKSETPVTISMADTVEDDISYTDVNNNAKTVKGTYSDRIVIDAGEAQTAHVTLDGVAIDRTRKDQTAALDVQRGALSLTLGQGSINVLRGYYEYAGLASGPENLLIDGEGSLFAYGGYDAAGIGGNTEDKAGNITIAGGNVTATGGMSASGIGGAKSGSVGTISISGGTVTAQGGESAAAIGAGSGWNGHLSIVGGISISGGTVSAVGGRDAAAIGSGYWRNNQLTNGIKITDGAIKATSGHDEAAAIGAGKSSNSVSVSITGGMFSNGEAVSRENPWGLVCGAKPAETHVAVSNSDDATKKDYPWTVMPYTTGDFTVTGGKLGVDYMYADHLLTVLTGKPLTISMSDAVSADVSYVDRNGVSQSIKGTNTDEIAIDPGKDKIADVTLKDVAINRSAYWAAPLATGEGKAKISLAAGSVNVLCGGPGAAGISVGFGGLELGGEGTLFAEGGKSAPGIGAFGEYGATGGNISVVGGVVTACSGAEAAGIGSGLRCRVGDISIIGGDVLAVGQEVNGYGTGAGIGSGSSGAVGDISISGGSVVAEGYDRSAGIGSGDGGLAGNISVTGGSVTATGGNGAAGIGSSFDGVAGSISISDGTVIATGGPGGAGIGAGYRADNDASASQGGTVEKISISGGAVTAKGGVCAAAIGSGLTSTMSDVSVVSEVQDGIEISGGAIQATAGGNVEGFETTSPAQAIGAGAGSAKVATAITGGVFADTDANAIANNTVYGVMPSAEYAVCANGDTATSASYPVAVAPVSVVTLKADASTVYGVPTSALKVSDIVASVAFGDTEVTGEKLDALAGISYAYRAADTKESATWTDGLPTEVGSYDLKVTVASRMLDGVQYAAATQEGTFTVKQSGSSVRAKTCQGADETSSFTYGDTITVKAAVSATGAAASGQSLAQRLAFAAPVQRQMALYFDVNGNGALDVGERQISEAVNVVDGVYTMTYNTANQVLPVGKGIKLIAKFVGDANQADAQAVLTVDIAKKTVTGVVDGSLAKTYDGDADITVPMMVDSDDLVNASDKVSASGSGMFADASADESKPVTVGAVAVSGEDADWYDVIAPAGITGAIDRKELTASLTGDAVKEYDGTTDLPGDHTVAVQLAGVVDGDAEKVSAATDAIAFADKNAGTKNIAATGVSLTGDASGNYVLKGAGADGKLATLSGTVTSGISQRTVTLVWSDHENRVYGDGKTVAATVGNLVAGEQVSAAVSGGNGTAAGSYTATASLSGDTDVLKNYQLPDNASCAYTIAQSATELKDIKVFKGETEASDFAYGDTITVTGAVNVTGTEPRPKKRSETRTDDVTNQVALFCGETQLTSWTDPGAGGAFKLSYNTLDKQVKPSSELSLTVIYRGNKNQADAKLPLSIQLAKAELTPSLEAADARAYDGTAELSGARIALAGAKGSDKPAVKTSSHAWTSADAGTTTANVLGIALTDADGTAWADFYTLTASELTDVRPANGASISPRVAELAWSDYQDRYVDDGKIVVATVSNVVTRPNAAAPDKVVVTVAGGTANTVGDYTAKATKLTGADAANYELPTGGTLTCAYTIGQSGSTFGDSLTTLNGGAASTSFTYGDSITVAGAVKATGAAPEGGVISHLLSLFAQGSQQNVAALFYRDVQLTDWVTPDEDGSFRLAYNTTKRLVPAGGEVALTVKYQGNNDRSNIQRDITVTLGKAVLTPSLAHADAKVYDGAIDASGGEITLTGAVKGDEPAATASVAWTAAAAGTSTLDATGIALADGVVRWSEFYELSANELRGVAPADGSAPTIAQRVITLAGAKVAGKEYDANANAAVTDLTLQNVVAGEGLSLGNGIAATATLDGASVGAHTAAVTTTLASDGIAANYTFADANGNPTRTATCSVSGIVVTPAPLTVTANDARVAYGDASPAYTVSYTGFKGADDVDSLGEGFATALKISCGYTPYAADAQAGSAHAIAATGPASAGNYALTYRAGTLSVGKATAPVARAAALTVSNGIAREMTLDVSAVLPALPAGASFGTVTYGVTGISLGDYYDAAVAPARIKGATLVLPVQAVDTDAEGRIGTVKIRVSSANFADFNATVEVSAVNPIAPAGEPRASATSLTYGDAMPALSGAFTDPVTGEPVAGALAWDDPGARMTAGSHAFKWTFTPQDAVHYLPVSGSIVIEVAPRALKVTGVGAAGKVFDGSVAATVTGEPALAAASAAGGVVAGDDVTLVPGSASFADAHAGTGKVVSFAGFVLTGSDAANYTLAQPDAATADIAPLELGADAFAVAAGPFTYTGSPVEPVVTVRGIGGTSLVEGADYTLAYAGNTAATAGGKQATATVTAMGDYTGSATFSFDIERAGWTYAVVNQMLPVYSAISELEVPAAGTGVTRADGAVEQVPGTLTWYADEARTRKLSADTLLTDGSDGTRTLWWTFEPNDSAGNANYTAGAAEGSMRVALTPVSAGGSVINPDGTITLPTDEDAGAIGGTVVPTVPGDNATPNKPVMGDDGSATLPDGGSYTPPAGTVGEDGSTGPVEVPVGGTVHPDGTVTDADGSVIWRPKEETSKPDPEPEPEPEPDPEPEPEPEPEPTPDPEPEPEPDPAPDPEPEPQPDSDPDQKPTSTPAPKPEGTQSAAKKPATQSKLPQSGDAALLPAIVATAGAVTSVAAGIILGRRKR